MQDPLFKIIRLKGEFKKFGEFVKRPSNPADACNEAIFCCKFIFDSNTEQAQYLCVVLYI